MTLDEKRIRIVKIIQSCETKVQLNSCYNFISFKNSFLAPDDVISRYLISHIINEQLTQLKN